MARERRNGLGVGSGVARLCGGTESSCVPDSELQDHRETRQPAASTALIDAAKKPVARRHSDGARAGHSPIRPGRKITFLSLTTSWSFKKSCTACESTSPSSARPCLDVVERVLADADVEHVLQDHRALVELLGDEVRRAAGHAHALLARLLVGVGARVVRQQRRVDVDDAVGELVDELGRQDAACSARGRRDRRETRASFSERNASCAALSVGCARHTNGMPARLGDRPRSTSWFDSTATRSPAS